MTLSIQKIIAFVIFVCAALISSLFIFHATHKAEIPSLPENSFIFPVAREIKPFELETINQQKFTQKNLSNHWTLLFFGFTHCSKICPTTMETMKHAYKKLQATYPTLQVVLISLDPERDTADTLSQYTHSFHANFIGATGKIQNIRKLQSQFGIFSARDETSGNNYQLQHTSSILLINPAGQWAGLFKYGMNPEEFANAFKQSVKILQTKANT